MKYQEEMCRRLLGYEDTIKIPSHVVPSPGLIIHHIHTVDTLKPLTLHIETGSDKLRLLLSDPYGTPLWLRYFDFEVAT